MKWACIEHLHPAGDNLRGDAASVPVLVVDAPPIPSENALYAIYAVTTGREVIDDHALLAIQWTPPSEQRTKVERLL